MGVGIIKEKVRVSIDAWRLKKVLREALSKDFNEQDALKEIEVPKRNLTTEEFLAEMEEYKKRKEEKLKG